MNFDLTDEQRLIQESVRRCADQEIAPVAAENDRAGRFPRELVNRMAAMGLLGGPIPKEYGGSGLDYISHAIITVVSDKAGSEVRPGDLVPVTNQRASVTTLHSLAPRPCSQPQGPRSSNRHKRPAAASAGIHLVATNRAYPLGQGEKPAILRAKT